MKIAVEVSKIMNKNDLEGYIIKQELNRYTGPLLPRENPSDPYMCIDPSKLIQYIATTSLVYYSIITGEYYELETPGSPH